MLAASIAVLLMPTQTTVLVNDMQGLRQALRLGKAGTHIRIAAGVYEGGVYAEKLQGTAQQPIVIEAADKANPPRFVGGGSTIQLSDVSHVVIRNLVIEKPRGNGLNIDDGGTPADTSHHIKIQGIHVRDTPKGNNDGIKLSGIEDFTVEDCTVERWGGSAVDMVGCHRGLITKCTFKSGIDSGVQCKGGTADVTIQASRFENAGQRSVNIGGSTGLQFFRPPLDKVPSGSRYEAKNITVQGCTFIASVAPIAFVGVDGAIVRYNTFINPLRWVIRILQETSTSDFVPSRNGVFENNLIVFNSRTWASGGLNIGPGTAPDTFKFAKNFWYCINEPERSRPMLPTAEAQGVYGIDPGLRSDLTVDPSSPAAKVGAHAWKSR